MEVLVHPVYSPNLVPPDFWFFEDLKWELHNGHFKSDVKLVTVVKHFFQDSPPEEFHKTMTATWKERMLACIANDGGYFKKYIVDYDDDDDNE